MQNERGSIDPCELSWLSAKALEKCDPEDGVVDGLISDPDGCIFDPYTLVNTSAVCWNGISKKISKEAAILAHTGWTGVKEAKSFFRPLNEGSTHEAALVTIGIPFFGPLLVSINATIGLADRYCRLDGNCF